jgi:hypothetical protein
MREFIEDFWDIILFAISLLGILVFGIIGIWTHREEAGQTAALLAIPAFVMICVMMERRAF